MKNVNIPFNYALIFILVLFIGCSNAPTSNNRDLLDTVKSPAGKIDSVGKIDPAFNEFLKKFKVLSLPLTIKTLAIVVDSSKKLNAKDNIFIKSEYPDEIYAYGLLPGEGDVYKVVWLEPTESEVPVLTTFTKDGKKVQQEELGVGGCGSDCGFECSESIRINKDFTIFSVDSISSTDCDTSGNLKKNTTKKYIRYKTGKILKSGKIDMTHVLKKPIS